MVYKFITVLLVTQAWLPTMHPDGFQIEMELASYGGKIALHKFGRENSSNKRKLFSLHTSSLPIQQCVVGLSA